MVPYSISRAAINLGYISKSTLLVVNAYYDIINRPALDLDPLDPSTTRISLNKHHQSRCSPIHTNLFTTTRSILHIAIHSLPTTHLSLNNHILYWTLLPCLLTVTLHISCRDHQTRSTLDVNASLWPVGTVVTGELLYSPSPTHSIPPHLIAFLPYPCPITRAWPLPLVGPPSLHPLTES